MPLRTPRDAFDELAPSSGLANIGISDSLPSGLCHAKRHKYNNENDDSEVHSEDSFENALSPPERILHQSAVDSSYGHEIMDESTSSDEDMLSSESEIKFERSHARTFGSRNFKKSDENTIGNAEFAYQTPPERRSHKGVSHRPYWKSSGSNLCISRAFWPHWVYRMYDSYSLAQRAAGMSLHFSFMISYTLLAEHVRFLASC